MNLPSRPALPTPTSGVPASGRPRRLAAAAATALGLTLAGVLPASAHVRVSADTATAGSYSALTFRVPTESETASTTKVAVQLPQDTPLSHVGTKPVPGWRATVTEAPLPRPVDVDGTTLTKAPRTVTWTAADPDEAIAPGQYQEFSISVGPLPGPGTLTLPATQTYSDGKVVRWDQPTPVGGAEPDLPAPALVVTAGADSHAAGAPPTPATTSLTATSASTAVVPDGPARTLGGAALVVAIGALATAVLAVRRRVRA